METQTITATVFIPPNGRRQIIEVTKVYPDDAAYIRQHDIKVSMEELMTGDTVVYFDDGKHIDDDPNEEPDEIIIISRGGKKTCEDCIKEGVELIKKRATGQPQKGTI